MVRLSKRNYSFVLSSVAIVSFLVWATNSGAAGGTRRKNLYNWGEFLLEDTTVTDSAYVKSRRPTYKPKDRRSDPFSNRNDESPLLLGPPANIKVDVTLDDSLKRFNIQERIGEIDYRNPTTMTFEEYSRYQQQQSIRNYWRAKSEGGIAGEAGGAASKRLIPKISVISPLFDRIFGGSTVDIQTNGNVGLKFGARFNRNFNQSLPLRQQRIGDFDFDQNLALNVVGKIGDKMKINFNWDTKANFEFENNMKLDYTGYEEEIIRKVEAGNVSLPLNNSLITGGQNLFGIKAQLQFGRLAVTAIASNVRGRTDEINIENGSQNRNFEIRASQYERDRHFFLSHFFRDRYNRALQNLPLVNSGITIRRLEVYITNDNRATENLRNMVATMDLGEANPTNIHRPDRLNNGSAPTRPTDNKSNRLYSILTGASRDNDRIDETLDQDVFEKTIDYEHVRARRLDPREYTFNPQLGYISLNTQLLPEQVLGVAYEYTFNGQTYQVGELQEDYQNVRENEVIFMKMLRSTNPAPVQLPVWDLMMKNIYPLNANQVTRQNFQLRLIYKDDETGVDIPTLKEGERVKDLPLVEVFNLDNVNTNNDRPRDGNFDFLPGITIDPENGRIIFPVVEPFGSFLNEKFTDQEQALREKYVYQELYELTQTDAQQFTNKDKFFLKGRYQASSSDEIALPGIQIAEGSVTVYSGGTRLTEGVDYQVDYNLARVKILNPSYLSSASNLKVNFERAELINPQPRAMVGVRLDYRVNNDISFGGTMLHLGETPYNNNRVSLGDEPSNNTIYGVDINLRRNSRFLTKLTDMLPLVQTKELSTITFNAEFAQLLPAKAKLQGEDGVSYIDDFESSEAAFSLASSYNSNNWRLASTPAPLTNGTGLAYAFNRAKLAWYTIDQGIYYRNGPRRPNNITESVLHNHYTRPVDRKEVFRNRDLDAINNSEYTFDLAYFPNERGQYNYNPNVSADGRYLNPNNQGLNINNYGGISREITFDNDFDNANIEYLEFWLMDPFIRSNSGLANITDDEGNDKPNTTGGELILNLGNISEDLLKNQNRYEFENGLPTTASTIDVATGRKPDTERTAWGFVSKLPFLTDAFDNNSGTRQHQDIGLEGLNDSEERQFFQGIYQNLPDPSGDNFKHHLNGDYDSRNVRILGRYKNYNGMEGNSAENSEESAYPYPDKEDLNKDNVISDVERYHEYRMVLKPGQLNVGENYIVDKVTKVVHKDEVTWYQFRIPVRQPTGNVGNINGFKSIRFMRMYMTQFQEPVVMRMLGLQFVSNQWRRYLGSISDTGAPCVGDCDFDVQNFSVSTVNIEENGAQETSVIPYVVPPGVVRLRDNSSTLQNRRQNEQSLQLCVDGLKDSFGKAVYKNVTMDMLIYKRLKLFLHAQSPNNNTRNDEVRAFIRIGTDYTQNYYEYSIPLKITPNSATTASDIWMPENFVDLAFQDLIDTKAERNRNSGSNIFQPWTRTLPNNATITVVGNPDLSAIQGIMLGVLNPRSPDRSDKSVCIWADELRVADFDKTAGWAANARMNAKLADFATISASGSYTTVGFGSLQQKVAQRARENTMQFDLNSNIAADKFFPEKLGVRIPVSVQYGTAMQEPRYDPLDPDTELRQSLQKFDDPAMRAAYRKEVVSQVTTKSINLLNVRKEKTNPEAKSKPYDLENLSLSYAYTEQLRTDIVTDRDFTKSYTGGLAYTYNNTPKNYTPLAKAKVFQSPYLKLLQELNITPLPSRIAFRADLDRRYNEIFLQRRLSFNDMPTTSGIVPTFQKYFFFNRIYDLKWDLTKSISFDYTATNRAVVDEPDGQIDKENPDLRYKNEVIWKNLRNWGRTTNFDQTAALTYRLPLDKFPLTDWISADARYAAGYTWTSGSTALISDTLQLGNTIQNNSEISVTGKIDLTRLYNKVKFLKAINEQAPKTAGGAASQPTRNPNAPVPADTAKKAPELKALKAVLRSLMTARSLNFTAAQNQGTLLPGYLPRTRVFGLDEGFDAPGVPFILGKQYELESLFRLAQSSGWYTDSSQYLNTPLSNLKTQNFNLRTVLEPFRNFNIQLDAKQDRSEINEVFYRLPVDVNDGTIGPDPVRQNPLNTGSFSSSFIALQTLFESSQDNASTAFDNFVRNRAVVLERLRAANQGGGEFAINSQDVLMPSFLAAYQGKSIDNYKARPSRPFGVFPLPNWRVDYNGLAELPFVQQYFSSITLSHVYNASYNISNFTTSLEYQNQPGKNELPTQVNEQGEYVPYYVISQVLISERLAPFLGVNFRTKNNISGRLEYRRERNLALNMTNAQITQNGIKDIVLGIGYTTNKFRVPFKINGEYKTLKNDLNARLDLTFRDNETIQRTIVVEDALEKTRSVVTNGTLQVQIKPTIDYTLNQRLNLQFYFTRVISDPKVANAFKNTVSEGGIQLRYSLSE
ncbi:MAG: cell surface protein SprA [Adhaeribacter sp.]